LELLDAIFFISNLDILFNIMAVNHLNNA
jgi:hypothetical protein